MASVSVWGFPVSCLFVLQSKSFIISMQLAADATIYGRFKHFSKVTIKIFSSTFNKKQHKSFFFGVFCFLRLAASVCPSVSLPFRVSFIFIRAFENFHTDSFKGDGSQSHQTCESHFLAASSVIRCIHYRCCIYC